MKIIMPGWTTLSLALLVVLLGLAACDRTTDSEIDGMVSVGTHSLHIRCIGRGRKSSPTVVIDTGFGDSSAKWDDMQAQIAPYARVCTYDRAGYGTSEPGPLPRHSQRVADELKCLLENAGVEGLYVLVGHSLGGLNVQVFADRYPDLVAGLVLLDPPPLQFITGEAFPELYQMAEQQTSELWQAAEAARQATDPEEQAKANYFETLASEHSMFNTKSAAQAVGIESFGDTPLVVVASGKPNPAFGEAAEAFQQFWIERSQELATKSTNGTFMLAEESSHHLYADVPNLVLDAIRQAVEQASKR